jgi:hypothetical protein
MTIHVERSALGFALLTSLAAVVGCARSPAALEESADFVADVMHVADASVSATDKRDSRDGGSESDEGDELAIPSVRVEADASTSAATRGPAYAETSDGAVSAVVPVASADSGALDPERVEPTNTSSGSTSSAPAETSKDSGVPAKSPSIDAGAVQPPAQVAPPVQATPPAPAAPVVVDAGSSAPTTRVDAGTTQASARCVAGRYAGAFRGQITQAQVGSVVITGTVTLQLTLSADGRSLDVSTGTVDARDSFGTPIRAEVDGTVDCASNQVKNGTLRGNYGAQAADDNVFTGVVEGTYDPAAPPTLRGTWKVPLANIDSSGTYEAALQN